MRLPSLRPSPSMAVSIMALVVASTGTSYAAGLIGPDDIKNNSIASVDIKKLIESTEGLPPSDKK